MLLTRTSECLVSFSSLCSIVDISVAAATVGLGISFGAIASSSFSVDDDDELTLIIVISLADIDPFVSPAMGVGQAMNLPFECL